MPNIDSATDLFNWLVSSWFATKANLEHGLGMHDGVLHVIGGAALQCILAFVLRLRFSHVLPWLGVLGLELANEWNDFFWASRAGEASAAAMASDMLLTMALPSFTFIVARWWSAAAPEHRQASPVRALEADPASGQP